MKLPSSNEITYKLVQLRDGSIIQTRYREPTMNRPIQSDSNKAAADSKSGIEL